MIEAITTACLFAAIVMIAFWAISRLFAEEDFSRGKWRCVACGRACDCGLSPLAVFAGPYCHECYKKALRGQL